MSVASSSDSTGNNNEDTQKDKPVGFEFFSFKYVAQNKLVKVRVFNF